MIDFFTKELPETNKGSMGRSLRAIKYLSVYLKNNGNTDLLLDFTQLNARGHHVRVIPPYSQEKISRAVSSIDTIIPGQKAYIPDEDYTLRRIAYEPYIFTDAELQALFYAVDGYEPSTNNKK